MDKLTSIRAFCSVARHGNFSVAARELGVSTAMVSKHIKQLEDSLGVRLMNRSTRQSQLTEAGGEYHRRCLQLLAQIEEMDAAVRTLTEEVRGVLKIAAPPTFGGLFLMPAVVEYKRIHPHVAVNLRMAQKTPDLVEGGFDLAIHAGNARLADSNLVARKLGAFRHVICASPAYLARAGIPHQPQDLASHNCLVFYDDVANDDWIFRSAASEISVHVRGDISSNQGNALRIAAVADAGVVRLPNYMVGEDIRAGRLVELLAEYQTQPRAVFALYHQRRHLPAKVRTFVDFLAERFAAGHDFSIGP
ncbi:MAG: LysR substrate-binding domain-containing protein [Gammaproteobacteria bacterium]